MSILDRILARAPFGGPQISAAPGRLPPICDLPAAPKTNTSPPVSAERPINVYDQFGRKIEVGREAWRKDVLLPNLAANRDNPDALHELIGDALRDDFAADVLDAARHLHDTDPQPRRGAVLLGAVLLQLKDFAGARDVLERAIGRLGEDPWMLSTLARSLAELGDAGRAEELIWRALALDPNEESALNWVAAQAGASGGPVAMLATYARAAMLPGSWRAHLALARSALERGDVGEVTRLYEEALGRAQPAPADLLMQMSDDLGSRGHNELLVRLTQPRFDVAAHGLIVGANLLRALVDLGMLTEARNLLEELYAQQRPDWREQLLAWEELLDDARKRYGEITAPLEVIVMRFEKPVWSRGVLGFDAVLPRKTTSAPHIHVVCASGEGPPDPAIDGKVVSQPTNDLGRITRALPMFFAEELYLRTCAKSVFLLPWMKQGGFVLSTHPWTRALLPPDQSPPELLIFTHIDATQSPWIVRVAIEQPRQPEAPTVVFELAFGLASAAQDAVLLLQDLLARVTDLLAVRCE
jgi:tetratricopeptide (TPR) repeat protein